MAPGGSGEGISRRTLLVGGGAAVGLLIAWGLWPREYEANLRAAPGETPFNAFLKIARDGRVTVAVPQVEIGQGVYTSLPQILADELGADWRTIGVEPAPINPLYANQLLAEETIAGGLPSAFEGIGRWATQEYATRTALMLTGGSSSIRAFEPRLREAGAAARTLLLQAAAKRFGTDWQTLDTAGGMVTGGPRPIRFADIAGEAVDFTVPDDIPVRGGIDNRLVGQPLPRLDLPAKVDGSAQFAGDIRLPGMVYAAVRAGPIGDGRLAGVDRDAADKVPGVFAIFEHERWAAAAATNWWAANRAVEALAPAFTTPNPLTGDARIERALTDALKSGDAAHSIARGEPDVMLESGDRYRAVYSAGVAANAPMEPLTATARFTGDRLEIWAPTQAPGLARAAAARAAGIGERRVTLYPTLIGSGYGRKLETAAIEQAAVIAGHLKRPVQLTWSRLEETMQDSFRPPAAAEMVARMESGRLMGWRARIAAPSASAQAIGRLTGRSGSGREADGAAVDGAIPPYDIEALAVHHLPADTGLAAGIWRSAAHSYTAFFTESFVDELARKAGMEPLSFRMQMLSGNPRLARCLSTAAAIGGWDGGTAGSALGLAAHSAWGSHVALLVEISVAAGNRIKVNRAVAAVDCGRIINPDIVRQLVEGGIVYGIGGATGSAISFSAGLPSARGFGDLGLPLLADTPEITVEIVESEEDPGGVTELSVPVVAPAIANAFHALTGRRLRRLPLAA